MSSEPTKPRPAGPEASGPDRAGSDRARHARLKVAFVEALDVEESDRAAWIAERHAGEPALRRELESLLALDQDTADAPTLEAVDLALTEEHHPRLSSRLGTYRIGERIGRGGMGVVYKAYDERLARPVALKFLAWGAGAPAPGAGGDSHARFLREARAAAALDDPNICTVYELGETEEGQSFLAMAYYAGETLEERLARGPLTWPEAVDVAGQAASGLAAAHRAGIVHRDIKPSNLMRTADGVVKILDFGIAKSEGNVTMTDMNAVVGTPSAMAPEQARGDLTDARTDIWGLGSVLYAMLAGVPPFAASGVQSLLYAIVHEPHRPLATLAPETPAWLTKIVERCLAKRPEDRFRDVESVRAALESGGGGRPAEAAPFRRRRWPKAAMVGGFVMAAALALVVAVGRFDHGPADGAESAVAKAAAEAPSATLVAAAAPPTLTLGVAPFAHDPADAELGMLAAGLAARIAGNLTKNQAITVIAPSSIMPLAVRSTPVAEMGARLGVGTMVTGRIERGQDGFRLMVDLVEVATGRVVEGARYEVASTDLPRVERAAARDISKALLDPSAVPRRAPVHPDIDPAAYRKLLAGIHLINQARFQEAVEPLREAIDIAPDLVPAWAALSRAYAYQGLLGLASPRAVFPAALAAAERALELEPGAGEALAGMAQAVIMARGDIASARDYAECAVEAGPGSAFVRYTRGALALTMDRQARGLEELERALVLDPLVPANRMMITRAHLRRHDWDAAIATSEANLALHPYFWPSRSQLAVALWHRGRRAEAIATLDEGHYARRLWEALDAGAPERAAAEVEAMARSWRAEAETAAADAINVAIGYAIVGDADAALDWMERCRAPMDRIQVLQSLHTPIIDFLRDTPRFRALLEALDAPSSFAQPGGDRRNPA